MGFLDVITGKRKLAGPAPDRLFAITTANVTFETSLASDEPRRRRDRVPAALDGRLPLDRDRHGGGRARHLRRQRRRPSTPATTATASAGSCFAAQDFDDLVVGINAVSGALESGGYGERVLCAVFSFEDADKHPVYFIYNYKRGSFYPFVPTGPEQRDTERELVLKAQIGPELPVEQELERWFPLWGAPI